MKLPWLPLSLIGWAIVVGFSYIPTTYWYELKFVNVTNSYSMTEEGYLTRVLEVERSINNSFRGWYHVEEQVQLDDGWFSLTVCNNERVVPYRKDAGLPDPVTVEWWAYGHCDTLPKPLKFKEQTFRLCTWVSIEIFPFISPLRKSTEPVCSQPYKNRAIPRYQVFK